MWILRNFATMNKTVEKKFLNRMKQIPDYSGKKYLLALSGGIDSMVLAHLLHKNNLNVELAHCNFGLRGKESELDQAFVENFAKELNIPIHINPCPVNTNDNTQLAARRLRYQWFQHLKEKHKFDYILTAHHLNDAIETFFINLFRGTGIQGLSGIPETPNYRRPLLDITREEIMEFAIENRVKWREDSSNASDKYVRNKIRHQLIPKIKEMNPDFEQNIQKTFHHLQDTQSIIKEWFEDRKEKLVKKNGNDEILNIQDWISTPNKNQFLYHWLKNHNFSDWESIYELPFAQTGKFIENQNHILLKHGENLILGPKTKKEETIFVFESIPNTIQEPVAAAFDIINKEEVSLNQMKETKNSSVFIDFDKIQFPLILRKKKDGDYFFPLGMKGKKKLSDYFKDEKISLIEKEKIWLFCDNKNIIWISGKRLDDRYKVNDETKKILKITLL